MDNWYKCIIYKQTTLIALQNLYIYKQHVYKTIWWKTNTFKYRKKNLFEFLKLNHFHNFEVNTPSLSNKTKLIEKIPQKHVIPRTTNSHKYHIRYLLHKYIILAIDLIGWFLRQWIAHFLINLLYYEDHDGGVVVTLPENIMKKPRNTSIKISYSSPNTYINEQRSIFYANHKCFQKNIWRYWLWSPRRKSRKKISKCNV